MPGTLFSVFCDPLCGALHDPPQNVKILQGVGAFERMIAVREEIQRNLLLCGDALYGTDIRPRVRLPEKCNAAPCSCG